MKNSIRKWICAGLTIVLAVTLCGCTMGEQNKEQSVNGFAFDTTYTITLYEGGNQKILNQCVKKCGEYEKIFSATAKNSQLYYLNELEKHYESVLKEHKKLQKKWKKNVANYSRQDIETIEQEIATKKSPKNTISYKIQKNGVMECRVSKELSRIIQVGLQYSTSSNNSFDIAIEPVTSLWDFTREAPKVPEKKAIEEALPYIDSSKIQVKEQRILFHMPGMGIDLGGIAKGYIADQLKEYLKEKGVTRAIINLGGNILCVGQKSQDEKFSIGVQQPFADRNETVAAVKINDLSVVSSGIYERYFKTKDGKLYHHIINPKTGYSYENDLIAVTIICKNSVDGDSLSTTCFSMGKEKGLQYINSLENVYAMFITKDEKISYSKGFQKFLIQ